MPGLIGLHVNILFNLLVNINSQLFSHRILQTKFIIITVELYDRQIFAGSLVAEIFIFPFHHQFSIVYFFILKIMQRYNIYLVRHFSV